MTRLFVVFLGLQVKFGLFVYIKKVLMNCVSTKIAIFQSKLKLIKTGQQSRVLFNTSYYRKMGVIATPAAVMNRKVF